MIQNALVEACLYLETNLDALYFVGSPFDQRRSTVCRPQMPLSMLGRLAHDVYHRSRRRPVPSNFDTACVSQTILLEHGRRHSLV